MHLRSAHHEHGLRDVHLLLAVGERVDGAQDPRMGTTRGGSRLLMTFENTKSTRISVRKKCTHVFFIARAVYFIHGPIKRAFSLLEPCVLFTDPPVFRILGRIQGGSSGKNCESITARSVFGVANVSTRILGKT